MTPDTKTLIEEAEQLLPQLRGGEEACRDGFRIAVGKSFTLVTNLISALKQAEERAINAETENAELRDGLSHNLTRTDEELAESAAREERLREVAAAAAYRFGKALDGQGVDWVEVPEFMALRAALDQPPTPSEAPRRGWTVNGVNGIPQSVMPPSEDTREKEGP